MVKATDCIIEKSMTSVQSMNSRSAQLSSPHDVVVDPGLRYCGAIRPHPLLLSPTGHDCYQYHDGSQHVEKGTDIARQCAGLGSVTDRLQVGRSHPEGVLHSIYRSNSSFLSSITYLHVPRYFTAGNFVTPSTMTTLLQFVFCLMRAALYHSLP